MHTHTHKHTHTHMHTTRTHSHTHYTHAIQCFTHTHQAPQSHPTPPAFLLDSSHRKRCIRWAPEEHEPTDAGHTGVTGNDFQSCVWCMLHLLDSRAAWAIRCRTRKCANCCQVWRPNLLLQSFSKNTDACIDSLRSTNPQMQVTQVRQEKPCHT